MRSRLQAAKAENIGPPHERQKQLERGLDWHQQENQFYGICYDLYRELHAKVVDVLQKPLLQSCFEPESSPAGDPFLYDSLRKLNATVKASQVRKAQAEAEWKRYWNILYAAGASAAWI